MERRLQLGRKIVRIEFAGFRRALLRHLLADVFPDVAEHRHVGIDRIVRDRHPRQFHDAAFNRIDQGEIGDHPREQRALLVTGAAQEEWRGGEIVDRADADLALERLDAGNP